MAAFTQCCVRLRKNVIDPSPWETLFLAGLSEWSYPDSLIMSQLTKRSTLESPKGGRLFDQKDKGANLSQALRSYD